MGILEIYQTTTSVVYKLRQLTIFKDLFESW